MTIDEIIEKQKRHLTNAQIKALAEKAEQYKLLHSAQRAEAQATLRNQYRTARRGLQNMGLASRQGKIISGREQGLNRALTRSYDEYNQGLRAAENAQLEAESNRMANATIRARQAAYAEQQKQLEEQQKKLQETQSAANQAAALQKVRGSNPDLWNEDVSDSGSGFKTREDEQAFFNYNPLQHTDAENLRYYQRVAQLNGVRASEINDYATQMALQAAQERSNRSTQAQSAFNRRLDDDNAQKRVKNAAEDYYASEAYRFSKDYGVNMTALKKSDPESASYIEDRLKDIYSDIDVLTPRYEKKIAAGGKEAKSARQRLADAYGELALLAESLNAPAEYRNLYYLTDEAFDVAFDAAKKLYEDELATGRVIEGDFNAQREAIEAGKELDGQAIQREATMRFAWFEKIKEDRDIKNAYYWTSYKVDMSATPKFDYSKWESPLTDYEKNWKLANQRGWSASDYDGKSKYDALINEWSYINGSTENLSTMYGKVKKDIGSVIDSFTGISRDAAYNWFIAECVSEFYGHRKNDKTYLTGGDKGEAVQMEAILTLANLMTKEERARFNTILRDEGADEADRYFEYLYNSVLPERYANEVNSITEDQTSTTLDRIAGSALSVYTNLAEGATGWFNKRETNDSIAAKNEAQRYNTAQNFRTSVGSHYGEVGNFLYQSLMSMADSATVGAISGGLGSLFQKAGMGAKWATRAGSLLGGSILGGSSFNSAYEEALQRGLSPDQARKVAFGNGVNEMLFESLSLDLLVSRFKTGDMLKVSEKAWKNWLVNTLVQGGVEGSEEVFTDMANNLWDKAVSGIYSEELQKLREYVSQGMSYEDAKAKVSEEFADQLWQSFLGGALSGGVMGGAAGAMHNVQMRGYEKQGKSIDSTLKAKIDGFQFKDKQMQELQKQSKKTNQDYGVLLQGYLAEKYGQFEGNVQQAVKDGTITNEDAALLDKWQKGEVTADEMQTVNETLAKLDIKPLQEIAQTQESIRFNQQVGVKNAETLRTFEAKQNEAQKQHDEEVAKIEADETLTDAQKEQKKAEAYQRMTDAQDKAREELSAKVGKKVDIKVEKDGMTVKTKKGSGKVTFDFSTYNDGKAENHNTVESMTEREKAALRIAQVVAALNGTNIKVESQFTSRKLADGTVEDLSKKNGYYDPETDTIHVNLNGTNSVLWTISHELTHRLATMNKQGYTELHDAIKNELTKENLTYSEVQTLEHSYQIDKLQEYLNKGMNLWDALVAYEESRGYKSADAEEEVIARCCEQFLAKTTFINSFANKHFRTARAVSAFLTRMNADMQQLFSDVNMRSTRAATTRNAEGMFETWNTDTSPEQDILNQVDTLDDIARKWENAVKMVDQKRRAKESAKAEDVKASTMDKDAHFEVHKYYDRIVQKIEDQNESGYTKVGEIKRGSIYEKIGMPVGSTYFDNGKILKEIHKVGDPLPIKYLRMVPEILANPTVITEANKPNTINVFGEIRRETGKPLLVGIVAVRDRTGKSVITKVRTTHQRFSDIAKIINDESVLYITEDKKRAKAWFQASRIDMPSGGTKFGFIRKITLSDDIVKLSDLKPQKKFSTQDKDFHLTQRSGEQRVFEMHGTTANAYGSSVELEGGTLLNRVRMMQNLAELYGSVTVTATSEKEAQAFEKAGAQRETDTFGDTKYGTWAFEHQEDQYRKDTEYDAKQKRNFANAVLKEVGTYRNFKREDLRVMRAKLEKAFAVLHNAWHGDGDQLVAWEYAERLFDQILNRYTEMTEADVEMRDAILAEMPRKTDGKGRVYREIEVTAAQMAEIRSAFESVAEYNRALSKALGARVVVKETENAQTLEDVFANNPYLDAETNEGDMPTVLLERVQETVGKRTNPYKAESAERAAMKEAVFEKALGIVGIEKSTTQKVREAVKEARAEERAKAKDKTAKAVSEARLAERMHEGAIRAKERRGFKDHMLETTRKRNEQQIKSDMIKMLQNGTNKIAKMLAHPTESSHIPVQLARTVVEYANVINDMLKYRMPKTGDNAGRVVGTKKGELNLDRILDAYKMSFENEEVIAQAKAENPNYDPRGSVLDNSDYDEQLVKMLEWVNAVARGKSIHDFDAYELRVLMNSMRGVIHTITDANKLIGTSERKAIWQVGSTMVDQLENAPKISRAERIYLAESLDLRRLAKIFSGSDENAEFVKLVKQLNDGAIEKERIAQALQSIFKPVTDQYGDEIRKWYGKNAEWIDTGITKNGHKIEITKGMRVSLALHVLNEGNMRHIENGGLTIPNREMYRKGMLKDAYANGELVRLKAEQIKDVISQMTDAEKAYVRAAKELFHKRTGYYINRTSLALLGYRKAIVENYFPIHTNKNFTKTDFAELKKDGSIEGQGFLKERVEASNPVYLEDITSVVNRQIRGVALYAGLAIPMRNFNAVMNASIYEDDNGVWSPKKTVKQVLIQKMGSFGADVVEGFLTDVSEMSHVDVSPMERFSGKLATNYVKAVLLGNLKVALKQVASYPTAAAVIPWKYLRKGLTAEKVDVDLIDKYTPLYQMRREGNANEIAYIMQKRGMEQKLPWLLGWITKMDVATVGRIWRAAEYMVADQHKDLPVGSDAYYQAVAKVFNDTVQQTQPNFSPLQRNAALRSKNPIVRSFVLFGTQRMQNGGILMEAAYELKHSKGKSKAEIQAAKRKLGRAVASQIVQNVLLIFASLGVDALRGRMKGWQDDDEKKVTAESLLKGIGDMFLSNAMGSFLGGSESYELLSAWYKDDAYDTEFTVPALEALEFIFNYVGHELPKTYKYLKSSEHTLEEKLEKAKTSGAKLVKAAGYATGFPFENAYKDLMKGIIPAIEDHKDYFKTGEFPQWWLHQSGRLDSKKTAANYKEWTDKGKKGSVYFYWEKKLKDLDGGYTAKAQALLEDRTLPDDDKAMLLRMLSDGDGWTNEGAVVYNANGDVKVDFTNIDTFRVSQLSDAKYKGMQKAVSMGVPEEYAASAFIKYTDIRKEMDSGYNDAFREWLQNTVKSPEQRAALELCVIGGNGEQKQYELGKDLIKSGMSSDEAYMLIEQMQKIKKADSEPYLEGLTEAQKKLIYEYKGWKWK